MTNFIEHFTQELLINTDRIAWVERQNNQVHYWDGDERHSINYGSDQLAMDAVDDFYQQTQLANSPPVIHVGDVVRIRHRPDKQKSNTNLTIKQIPTHKHPFWVVEYLDLGTPRLHAFDTNIDLEIVA